MPKSLLSEIWDRRSLIVLFAFNDVKLRYRNSVLGFAWTFLEPLLMLTVLYFVFTNIIKNNIEDYPLYLLLGLIIWYMFSRATTMGLSSLTDKSGIIQKVYFRHEIVVISSCLTAFIMMVFEFAAFGVFLAAFKFIPPSTAILLPLMLIDIFFLSLGMALILSILNVYLRDIRFIWQVLLQAGFFLSPIIYKLNMFPDNIKQILELNPIVTILDVTHGLVLNGSLPTTHAIAYIISSTVVLIIIGLLVFNSKNKTIVEEL